MAQVPLDDLTFPSDKPKKGRVKVVTFPGNTRPCHDCNKAVVDHEYDGATRTYVLHDGRHVQTIKPGGNRTAKPKGPPAVTPSKRPGPRPGSRMKKRPPPIPGGRVKS